MMENIWEYLVILFLRWKDVLYAIAIFLVAAIMSFEAFLPLFGSISVSLIAFACMFIIFMIFHEFGIGWTLLSLIPIGLFLFYVTKKMNKSCL